MCLTGEWYRAAAWLGSDQLDAAFALTPCGCDLAARAEREPEPTARVALERAAIEAQAAWGCHLAECEPQPRTHNQQRTCEAIARMTGWSPPDNTCPRAALSHPALIDALRLLPAVEHGALPGFGEIPAVLHDAAYTAAQGRGERIEYEDRIREQRARSSRETR